VSGFPTPTMGVVCLRDDEVLLIKRGNPPRQGQWSLRASGACRAAA